MPEPNLKPRISVSIGNEIAISDIANQLETDSGKVKAELEAAIREHYFHFASKPINLEYEPAKGYTLRASSAVGIVTTPSFILDIKPKIPSLSIGKALGLAQESGINLLNINNQSLAHNALSEQSSYTSVDFLGFSLVNSVLTVQHNGYARMFIDILRPATKLRGDIAFQETIAAGLSLYNPMVSDIEPTLNVYPNQIIKAALLLCFKNSTSKQLKELTQLLLDSLLEVSEVASEQLQLQTLFSAFTVPRPDYDMALAFSKALLEGRIISEADNSVLTPSFTLDMDKVFESYCTTQIQKLIVPERFEVLAQQQLPHDMRPNIADKNIIPDVIIKDKRDGQLIILDLKNKYSQLRDEGGFKISNPDLYQLSYYAKTLRAKCCFVVYPGAKPKIQYPLKASESQASYETKRLQKLAEINAKSKIEIFSQQPVTLYTYSINLLGSLQDTRRSVASLCQLIIDI